MSDSRPILHPEHALRVLLAELVSAGVVNLYLHELPYQGRERSTARAIRDAYASVGMAVPNQFAANDHLNVP